MKALVDWLKRAAKTIAAQRENLLNAAKFTAGNGGGKTILRIGTSGLFYTADLVASKPFDYILFPHIMASFPWYWGIPFLTVCSFFYCLASVNFYDYIDADALVIEDIKGLRDYQGRSIWKRMFGWLLRKGDLPAFLALAFKWDPAFAVIYFRDSDKKYSGIQDKRSWKIFLGSLPINMWWCFPSYFMGVYGSPIVSLFWATYGPFMTWFAIESVTLSALCCALWYWLVLKQKDNT